MCSEERLNRPLERFHLVAYTTAIGNSITDIVQGQESQIEHERLPSRLALVGPGAAAERNQARERRTIA
jgi:hypothetical protein